jgi:prepilin-type N-terminal cleavage/methylation domain-containing protein
MNDEGYTLVEMLVALGIISLMLGGLVESSRVFGRSQTAASHALHDIATRAATDRVLRELVEDKGPFLSSGVGGFEGGRFGFSFDCGAGVRCAAGIKRGSGETRLEAYGGARLPRSIRLPGHPSLRYSGDDGATVQWPPSGDDLTALRSISLVDDDKGSAPLATVTIPIDDPPVCAAGSPCEGRP